MDERLPTELWVDAHVRKLNTLGMSVYIAQKGEKTGGMVLVKLYFLRDKKCRVLTQVRDYETNKLGWIDVFEGELVLESEADQYIREERMNDPDLWVVEVETQEDENPFEGKLITL